MTWLYFSIIIESIVTSASLHHCQLTMANIRLDSIGIDHKNVMNISRGGVNESNMVQVDGWNLRQVAVKNVVL